MEAVGENMKQLEISAEKAQEREEKLKDKIHALMERLKVAEARYEYGEMNISKLNLRWVNNRFPEIVNTFLEQYSSKNNLQFSLPDSP